jgi:hypothetical protein
VKHRALYLPAHARVSARGLLRVADAAIAALAQPNARSRGSSRS